MSFFELLHVTDCANLKPAYPMGFTNYDEDGYLMEDESQWDEEKNHEDYDDESFDAKEAEETEWE